MNSEIGLSRHVRILRLCYRTLLGRELVPAGISDDQAAAWLDAAPFALVSHGVGHDPVFNYANKTGLRLFGMDWDSFTKMPSRLSAASQDRLERSRLLEQVTQHGYIEHYSGIRLAGDGKKFKILDATVWNLWDETLAPYGQAAMIPKWETP